MLVAHKWFLCKLCSSVSTGRLNMRQWLQSWVRTKASRLSLPVRMSGWMSLSDLWWLPTWDQLPRKDLKNQTAGCNTIQVLYKSQPLLLDAEGNADANIEFTFGPATNVEYSCSITWKNRMLVYGGWGNYQYQISEVSDCSLTVIGELPFTHLYGACTVANEQIYLCFSQFPTETAGKLCYQTDDPLGGFSALPQIEGLRGVLISYFSNSYWDPYIQSNYKHLHTRVAASSVDLLAMGGETKPKAEMFNFSSRSWREIDRFPFGGAVETLAPLIFTDGFYYTFGGYRGEDYNFMPTDSSIIARLDVNGSRWEKVGELVGPRYGHGAIWDGSSFFIVGGKSSRDIWGGKVMTEVCKWSSNSIVCEEIKPELQSFYSYPEIFIVDRFYCNGNQK